MTLTRFAARSTYVAVALAGLVAACDDASSCPKDSCNPASDGTPFDVLDWCQTSGLCLRDGMPVPICPHADASPPPSCSFGPVSSNETLSFPLGSLASTLGGRRDLVVVYAQCDRDSEPAELQDLQVFYDGVPAPCMAANPCDPGDSPTVMTCRGVPDTVQLVTVSFSYDGAQGKTSLHVEMQDTTCSYFCE